MVRFLSSSEVKTGSTLEPKIIALAPGKCFLGRVDDVEATGRALYRRPKHRLFSERFDH